MKPGDALVSSISKERVKGLYVMKSYSVLTCLKEPAPPDAFRPGYCDRRQTIYRARDLRRDLLPRLPLPPPPKPEEVKDLRIKTYPPALANSQETFARPWIETNFFEGDQAEYQSEGYGRAVAEKTGRASLLLMLDFQPQEKDSPSPEPRPVRPGPVGTGGKRLSGLDGARRLGQWAKVGNRLRGRPARRREDGQREPVLPEDGLPGRHADPAR